MLERLGYPGRGYFTIILVVHAASVGLLLGWIVVEPRMWWRNLLSIAFIVVLTWLAYHAYRLVDRGFNRVDRWLDSLNPSSKGQT